MPWFLVFPDIPSLRECLGVHCKVTKIETTLLPEEAVSVLDVSEVNGVLRDALYYTSLE